MLDALLGPQMIALLTVMGIDLVLSGDNAVVIGTAAAGLAADLRRRAIVIGIIIAALTRMASKEHGEVLVFGLALSIALMRFAANLIAGVMERRRWIAYVGVMLVAYVSVDMIWRGSLEVVTQVQAAM